ncbi:hypothetical protein Tco_0514558 [Tanacetum coccineum]
MCLLCESILDEIPAFNFFCASFESITAIENHLEMGVLSGLHGKKVWEDIPVVPGLKFGGPTTLIADETVHEERGDNVERATTTATSLDAEQDSGNINRTQFMAIPNDRFPQGIGSDSSPRCQEAIGNTIAQTRSERVYIPSYDSPLLGVMLDIRKRLGHPVYFTVYYSS